MPESLHTIKQMKTLCLGSTAFIGFRTEKSVKHKRIVTNKEAHLIIKAKTLHPFGINRRDETRQ